MADDFYLYADSNTSVTLRPEYDFKSGHRKIESRYRSKSGPEYAYKWSDYVRISFTVTHLNSADATQINSWWLSNTELLFQQGSETPVNVRIAGNESPINKRSEPNTYMHEGEIILEGY